MKRQRKGGFLISKIHQLSARIFARMLKESGIRDINPAQGRIMFVLWQNDGIAINDLAKETSLSKSTLTSMLDRLEIAGLVRRKASKKDRRKINIWRTEKDKSLQKQYISFSKKMTDIYYNGLSEGEITQFEQMLEHIFKNLKASE
jgi:DNA-binding MarR family transcriptional regulator